MLDVSTIIMEVRVQQTPKRIKRLLREWAARAHEEELRRALKPLGAAFEHWKQGAVSSGELAERLHEFHQGPARRLFVQYNGGILEAAVAYAVVTGVFDRTSVPRELMEHLARTIEFYEAQEREP